MKEVEDRVYHIRGRKEDLEVLDKVLRHCEYLGNIGASRNILIRVDGDGAGRIKVKKVEKLIIYEETPIDKEHYNTEQNLEQVATVGIYDVG